MLSALIKLQLQIVSSFGNSISLIISVVIIISVLMILSRMYRELFLFLISLFSLIYSAFLKILFKHPRPENYMPSNVYGDVYSFPSSHVVFYTVFFGYLLYLGYKLNNIPKWLRIVVILVSAYMVSLVGVSRVYLGAHYVSDVLAGYIFGALYLSILIFLDKKGQKSMPKYQNKNR